MLIKNGLPLILSKYRTNNFTYFLQISYDLLLFILYSVCIWHHLYRSELFQAHKNLFFFKKNRELLNLCKKKMSIMAMDAMRMYASF